MTPAGIEPATFRLVAQHLNRCATAVPWYKKEKKIWHSLTISFGILACLQIILKLTHPSPSTMTYFIS